MSDTPIRILLLGGGFGGLYTAIELEKRLVRHADVDITLVNRDNFFSFTPMLHEVAASDLDMTHIVNPVRKMRVALDWTLDLLFSKDLVQFNTLRSPTVSGADPR